MILASDWIAFHADRTPEKLALIDQQTGRRFTYGEFNERSAVEGPPISGLLLTRRSEKRLTHFPSFRHLPQRGQEI